jgi:hypothetical protein
MQIRLTKPIKVGEGDQARTLSKSVKVGEGDDAVTFDVIELDLDALTGADIEFCVREAAAQKGENVRVLVIDIDFHMQVAAKASGVPVEAFKRLPARDYVEVQTVVQAFLTGSV